MTELLTPLTAFKQFIAVQSTTKYLLLVSGGVDSMTLLHVALKVLPAKNLAILHCNHQTRKECDQEETCLKNICQESGVKFYNQAIQTAEKNREANWRSQRKTAADKAAQDFGADKVLTAHHATDLVETVLFNLCKGAGPKGLSPHDPSSKPFWSLSKEDIITYATAQNLDWFEDSSNQNTDLQRNLIRHQVIPALRQITPNLEKVFLRQHQTFAQLADLIQTELIIQCQTALETGQMPLNDFQSLHASIQEALLRQISNTNISQAELTDTLKWLLSQPQGGSGKKLGKTALKIENQKLSWTVENI